MLQWIKRKFADKVRKLVGQELSDYTVRMLPEWQQLVVNNNSAVKPAEVGAAIQDYVCYEVTKALMRDRDFVDNVADELHKASDLVESIAYDVDLSDLASKLDLREVANEIDKAELIENVEIDANSVAANIAANHIKISDIVAKLDMSDLARHIVSRLAYSDFAGSLDYRKLATAMLQELLPKEVGANHV